MSHIKDVISANIFAMECDNDFNGKNFDVATGNNISLNEIKEIALKYFPDANFQYIEEHYPK